MNFVDQVLEFLKDKEWHTYGQILAEVGSTIPAEKATHGVGSDTQTLDQKIDIGRKRILNKTLSGLLRQGKINVRGEDFTRDVKLADGVDTKVFLMEKINALISAKNRIPERDKAIFESAVGIIREISRRIE